jgi:alkylation response protein AidB-like acyl-CoA dehydrogenase
MQQTQVTTDAGSLAGPLSWPSQPRVKLGMTGAEPTLSETERHFQEIAHAFACNVMRPLGQQMDRLTAEEVIASGSPFWTVRAKFRELGINPLTLSELDPKDVARIMPIINEEFGWGDGGLAVSLGSGQLPTLLTLVFGKAYLLERFSVDQIGCWAITEPDHGTDALDPGRQIFHPGGTYGRPNCVARISADKVVISGQKSAWVSNGPVAEVCVLYCSADTGNGPDPQKGAVLLVPLNLKGVSRGRPLDKMGQRALPQGEIFFDDVEIPLDHVLVGPDAFQRAVYAVHTEANMAMGAIWTGTARAAFEIAWEYAHARKQGGAPIYRHQSVAYRLFHMYRRVEAARALVRRVTEFNMLANVPALQSAMAAKVTCTQAAFENASDAIQMLGGNGVTREYPIEKIFRDARAAMIEDGCNEILAIKAGYQMMDLDLL